MPRIPFGRSLPDPRRKLTFLDSCAFDPKYHPEDEAAQRIRLLRREVKISIVLAHSNQKEIDHPNTPADVKAEAADMNCTAETSLTLGEEPEQRRDLSVPVGVDVGFAQARGIEVVRGEAVHGDGAEADGQLGVLYLTGGERDSGEVVPGSEGRLHRDGHGTLSCRGGGEQGHGGEEGRGEKRRRARCGGRGEDEEVAESASHGGLLESRVDMPA